MFDFLKEYAWFAWNTSLYNCNQLTFFPAIGFWILHLEYFFYAVRLIKWYFVRCSFFMQICNAELITFQVILMKSVSFEESCKLRWLTGIVMYRLQAHTRALLIGELIFDSKPKNSPASVVLIQNLRCIDCWKGCSYCTLLICIKKESGQTSWQIQPTGISNCILGIPA